jgi:hypothetical protein
MGVLMVGDRFGLLEVTELYGVPEPKSNGKVRVRSMAVCKCDCGNEVKVRRDDLRTARTRSCGCLKVRGPHVYSHNRAMK